MPYQIKPVLYVIYISATPFLITFIALIHLNLFFCQLGNRTILTTAFISSTIRSATICVFYDVLSTF